MGLRLGDQRHRGHGLPATSPGVIESNSDGMMTVNTLKVALKKGEKLIVEMGHDEVCLCGSLTWANKRCRGWGAQ